MKHTIIKSISKENFESPCRSVRIIIIIMIIIKKDTFVMAVTHINVTSEMERGQFSFSLQDFLYFCSESEGQ
jgi:hypothetical protein